MEVITRKCSSCKNILDLTNYRKETKTCNICLEKAKKYYADNRDVMVQRSRDYRLNRVEKEKDINKLYDRKCGRCRTILNLTYYKNENLTCNICLEKNKDNYANNRDVMVQRNKDYRLNNLEK